MRNRFSNGHRYGATRVSLVVGSEDEPVTFEARRTWTTSEDHAHVPGRGSPRRGYYHNRARNKHWHDPIRYRDIAHGKGSYRRLPAVARRPRTKMLVHSRGFPCDIGIHDLNSALRHSVPASNAVKQRPKLFTKFQARRQSRWQAGASSSLELPAFVVKASDSRWS